MALLSPVQSSQQALGIMCHSTINLNACWVLVDVLLPKHCHVNEPGSAASTVPVSAILSPERQFRTLNDKIEHTFLQGQGNPLDSQVQGVGV